MSMPTELSDALPLIRKLSAYFARKYDAAQHLDDIVGESALNACKYWDRVQSARNPAGYLDAIIRSAALKVIRSARQYQLPDGVDPADDFEPDIETMLGTLARTQLECDIVPFIAVGATDGWIASCLGVAPEAVHEARAAMGARV